MVSIFINFACCCPCNIYWQHRDEQLRDLSSRCHLHLHPKLSIQHTRKRQNSSAISGAVYNKLHHNLLDRVRFHRLFPIVQLLINHKNDDLDGRIPEHSQTNQIHCNRDRKPYVRGNN